MYSQSTNPMEEIVTAPKGNQFWLARSSHGRHPIFSDPEVLLGACKEYFQWAEDHPLQEHKVTCVNGEQVDMYVDRLRAMTLSGLCIFLGISVNTWKTYKKNQDFLMVTDEVEDSIRDQKFAGASAGLLNANIIARDLGLVDKKDITQDVTIGEKQVEDMTDEELQAELDRD